MQHGQQAGHLEQLIGQLDRLAVGTAERRPVVAGDKVAVATIMSCTLACDHRVVDGAVGAELMNAFKVLIEDPVRMLV